MRIFAASLMLAVVAPPAQAANEKIDKQLEKVLAMTPADFQRTATLMDDSLETVAVITTQPGFQNKKGLMKIVWEDNFLRALIDKKTGQTTYQVYQIIPYSGRWRLYHTANYETSDGPKSVELIVIDRSVGSCSRYGCSFTEHIAFPVDEPLLRQIAALYAPSKPVAWKFKFKAKAADDWNDGITASEVAGFLSAVDIYKSGLNRR